MSTFTPNPKLSPETNPRDWAYELACLPQDANIIFTKDSLLRFLKTHNVDVSPNYVEINKLPKYAQIGKMTNTPKDVSNLTERVANIQTEQQSQQPRAAPSPPTVVPSPTVEPTPAVAPVMAAAIPQQPVQTAAKVASQPQSQYTEPGLLHNPDVVTPDGEEFRPTRRVREPIGGGSAQITALFGAGETEENDYTVEAARESARRRGLLTEIPNQQQQNQQVVYDNGNGKATVVTPDGEEFRPTRRVREPIGGGSAQISALFGGN